MNQKIIDQKIMSKDTMKQNITIIGAGLVGSMMAIYLGKRGYKVDVFDKLPDIRKETISAGRSINLALANRGIRPMQQLGIMDKVETLLIPMKGRMLHDTDGELQFQSYGQKDHEVIYSVSRGGLVSLLRDEAEATNNVTFNFKQGLESIDYDKNCINLIDKSGKSLQHNFEILLGADGAGSRVRNSFEAQGVKGFSSELLSHSYKELEIEANDIGPNRFKIDKNSLHIWPRGEYMLIALPNLDGSFTVTLFMPNEGELSFESLTDKEAVNSFFSNQFKDVLELVPNLANEFFENSTGILGTIRCKQWNHKNALILGDSAHAIVPFHGQGMNCGFEDCYELNRLLEEHNDDWKKVMSVYTETRVDNANAIADMALDNYIEMRDSVRDPKFHLKKAIAFELESNFPDRFIPRYSMVMFHHIPYSIAQSRGQIQFEILDRLSAGIDDVKQLDLKLAEKLVKKELPVIFHKEL
jgi:kynurenine 3-monooxygenase